MNIVRLAEQLLISPPAPQIQKKPRLNAEQVRALKVRWDEIQAADRIARKKVKAKMLVEGRAELESIPLDPDVKESLNTELDEEIRDIGEDNGRSAYNADVLGRLVEFIGAHEVGAAGVDDLRREARIADHHQILPKTSQASSA